LGDKDRDVTFLLRSSPFGSISHGHADQNAFIIEGFGQSLALATGYYPWYGSPHHHKWTRSTRAVNSILVDHEGQIIRSRKANGRITAFELGDGYDYVEAEAANAYGKRLNRFRRHVVHVQPGIFVIFDDLAGPKPATYQWLLHAHEKIGIDGQILHVRRGAAAMKVHLLTPTGLTITQNDRYDPPPEEQDLKRLNWKRTWHLSASTTEPSASERFLSVLLVHRKADADDLPKVERIEEAGAIGVRLTAPNGDTDVIAFGTDPEASRIKCGRLTGTGRVLAEGRDKAGNVIRELRVKNED
jgi:hypothetical protein